MIQKQVVESLLNTCELEGKEFFVVDCKVSTDNKIQVIVDSVMGITIDDCIAISRHVEFNLDRETEDFELTVSSAGANSPLKAIKQYTKNIGRELEIARRETKPVKAR
ncbi:MAG: ribosome assembly cofactor RimP [Bacteroidales bacterium]|nr:ribosome assembly cofactor RimP [Bacteroidales bacterium]